MRFIYLIAMLATVWCIPACQSGKPTATTTTEAEAGKLSASARLFQQSLDKSGGVLTDEMRQKFALLEKDGKDYVRGTLKVSSASASDAAITQTGTLIESRVGDIWTVLIPIDQLEELTQKTEITYLDLDTLSTKTK